MLAASGRMVSMGEPILTTCPGLPTISVTTPAPGARITIVPRASSAASFSSISEIFVRSASIWLSVSVSRVASLYSAS